MLSVKCHFVNGLYIQNNLAVNYLPATSDLITIHMLKNDGLENFLIFFVFSHPGGSVSLPGVWESGCISGRPGWSGRVHMYVTMELSKSSRKSVFVCKKLVINTTKCDLCLFLHKMCCKMVWKSCDIWKSYNGNWLLDGPNSVRFYLTVWDMGCIYYSFPLF